MTPEEGGQQSDALASVNAGDDVSVVVRETRPLPQADHVDQVGAAEAREIESATRQEPAPRAEPAVVHADSVERVEHVQVRDEPVRVREERTEVRAEPTQAHPETVAVAAAVERPAPAPRPAPSEPAKVELPPGLVLVETARSSSANLNEMYVPDQQPKRQRRPRREDTQSSSNVEMVQIETGKDAGPGASIH